MSITGTQKDIDEKIVTFFSCKYIPIEAVTVVPSTHAERLSTFLSRMATVVILTSLTVAVIGLSIRIARWGLGI